MVTGIIAWIFAVIGLFRPSSRFLTEPVGPRVSFSEVEGELVFVWTSVAPQIGSSIAIRQNACLSHSATRTWRVVLATMEWNYLNAGHCWSVVYTARVGDLDADCEYQYTLGSGAFWTKEITVTGRTAYQLPGDLSTVNRSADFIVYGDMGAGVFSRQTREHIASYIDHNHVDAVVHTGDIVYDLDGRTFYLTRSYFAEIEPFASRRPYMILPGNHERSFNFTQFSMLFRMPRTAANNGSNLFYSFNVGRAHVICMSTDLYRPEYQESLLTQTNWLLADLATVNTMRDRTPWVVVMMHEPIYIQQGGQDELQIERNRKMHRELEGIFERYRVDLVVASHEHCYRRWTALYNDSAVASDYQSENFYLNPHAPVYITSGAAGNEEGNAVLHAVPNPLVLFESRLLGFGHLHIPNSTHLRWQQLESLNRTVIDCLWIQKD